MGHLNNYHSCSKHIAGRFNNHKMQIEWQTLYMYNQAQRSYNFLMPTTQQSMKVSLLINMKNANTQLNRARKQFYLSVICCLLAGKFHTQLGWDGSSFIFFGPGQDHHYLPVHMSQYIPVSEMYIVSPRWNRLFNEQSQHTFPLKNK